MKPIEHDILKCYEVLDLHPGASAEQVRKAYVDLAHVWDPERHATDSPLHQLAIEKRLALDGAYNALLAFLPSVQDGSPTVVSPVRPTDAITDQLIPQSPVQSQFMLFSFVALLTVLVILFGVISLWHGMSHVPNHPSPTVVEE